MKICIISTTIIPCYDPSGSNAKYSGLEIIAWHVVNGLARKGHEILLVAPNGSELPPNVEMHGTTIGESEQQAYSGYWQRLNNYDCIIDHSWNKFSYILKIEGKLKAPVLGVCHAPIDTMYRTVPPVPLPCLVAISKDMADHISQHLGATARVAYNGIDLDFYKPNNSDRTDRYLFLARMSRIKGPHIAVDIARQLRFGLDLVGDDKLTGEPDYCHRLMALAKHNITYHGGVDRKKTVEFFSSAYCLLHMNKFFREPLGLAPLEAQACGCPVIAFDNGAMRETIKNGETGFLVKDESEVIKLIKDDAIKNINRDYCREWAGQFNIQKMIDRYEELCIEALDTGGW